jgi:hypothetical protein
MNFAKVSRTLWRSRKFRSLGSNGARLLYLYLITCPHGNSAGCFALPVMYACADLGIDEASFRKGIDALTNAGLIDWDEDEEIVRIVGWFRFNVPHNPRFQQGVRAVIRAVQSARLREASMQELEAVLQNKPEPDDDPDGGSGEGQQRVSEGSANIKIEIESKNETEMTPSAIATGVGAPKRARKKQLVPFPDDLALDDKLRDVAVKAGVPAHRVESEWQRFRDHAEKKDLRYASWTAAWRNWCSSPYQAQTASVIAYPARPPPIRQQALNALQTIRDKVQDHGFDDADHTVPAPPKLLSS